MENRIKNVMSAVFDIPFEKINDESSPDNIMSWDSLKHMQLVVALEEEFRIVFEDEEIIEMLNYSSIKQNIAKKVKQ
jgi:acyl carrier protein